VRVRGSCVLRRAICGRAAGADPTWDLGTSNKQPAVPPGLGWVQVDCRLLLTRLQHGCRLCGKGGAAYSGPCPFLARGREPPGQGPSGRCLAARSASAHLAKYGFEELRRSTSLSRRAGGESQERLSGWVTKCVCQGERSSGWPTGCRLVASSLQLSRLRPKPSSR
jgi:hypothetical protein